jgi:hypothetical protein
MALSKKAKAAKKAEPKVKAPYTKQIKLMHTCYPRSNKSLCEACVAEKK